MTVQATVLIPTHDNGPTILYSVRSALAQTVREIEVFIVGDGVPDVTRNIVADLMKGDPRLRFFDNSKGPRHGEIHRHAALAHASGEIVAYLADDDLWLPNHIEAMLRLLRDADFAHALPVWVATDGSFGTWIADVEIPFARNRLLSGENRIPFACGAHTLAMYRKLAGWRTTPEGTFTDLYMWQQFLGHPKCRAVSGTEPTVLHFPRPWRADWTIQERTDELERWADRLTDSTWRNQFLLDVLDSATRERARLEAQTAALNEQVRALQDQSGKREVELEKVGSERDGLRAERDGLRAERDGLRAERDGLRAERDDFGARLQAAAGERDSLRNELRSIHSLRWWRLRERLLRLPLAAKLVRLVGRVLAGPSDR